MSKILIEVLIEILIVVILGGSMYYIFFLTPDRRYEQKLKLGRKFQIQELCPGKYEYLDVWIMCGKEIVVARLVQPSIPFNGPLDGNQKHKINHVNEWIIITWKSNKVLFSKKTGCFTGNFEISTNPKKPPGQNREITWR